MSDERLAPLLIDDKCSGLVLEVKEPGRHPGELLLLVRDGFQEPVSFGLTEHDVIELYTFLAGWVYARTLDEFRATGQ